MKLSQRRLARPSLGGMLATRQGSLTLALICAVCAAGILVFALGRYKTSLRTPVTQASVLVATSEIPKGTSGQAVASQRLYKIEPVATSQVSPGALSDAATIANSFASVDILPGQQLTTTDFTGITELAQTLAPGHRAVEVPIGEAPGATDIVQPGDRVDVYVSLPVHHAGTTGTSDGQDISVPLLTNVLVIKTAAGTPTRHDGVLIPGGDMVLDLTTDEVDPLIESMQNNHALYLTLRPANATMTPGTGFAAGVSKFFSQNLNSLSPSDPNLPTTP